MVPSRTRTSRRTGTGASSTESTEVGPVDTRVTDLAAPASENEYAMGEPL